MLNYALVVSFTFSVYFSLASTEGSLGGGSGGGGGGIMMEECLLAIPAVLAHDPPALKILHQEVDEAI